MVNGKCMLLAQIYTNSHTHNNFRLKQKPHTTKRALWRRQWLLARCKLPINEANNDGLYFLNVFWSFSLRFGWLSLSLCRLFFRCCAVAQRVQESIKALYSMFALINSHLNICLWCVNVCVFFACCCSPSEKKHTRFVCCSLLLVFSSTVEIVFCWSDNNRCLLSLRRPIHGIKTRTHSPNYAFRMKMNEQTLSGQLVAEIQTSAYLIGFFFSLYRCTFFSFRDFTVLDHLIRHDGLFFAEWLFFSSLPSLNIKRRLVNVH